MFRLLRIKWFRSPVYLQPIEEAFALELVPYLFGNSLLHVWLFKDVVNDVV